MAPSLQKPPFLYKTQCKVDACLPGEFRWWRCARCRLLRRRRSKLVLHIAKGVMGYESSLNFCGRITESVRCTVTVLGDVKPFRSVISNLLIRAMDVRKMATSVSILYRACSPSRRTLRSMPSREVSTSQRTTSLAPDWKRDDPSGRGSCLRRLTQEPPGDS